MFPNQVSLICSTGLSDPTSLPGSLTDSSLKAQSWPWDSQIVDKQKLINYNNKNKNKNNYKTFCFTWLIFRIFSDLLITPYYYFMSSWYKRFHIVNIYQPINYFANTKFNFNWWPWWTRNVYPTKNYLFKVNNRNIKTRCQWRRFGVFVVIVNTFHIFF